MKVANIMNFVRYIDERMEDSVKNLYKMTAQELEIVNEFGLENTFLLQYDAVIDRNYQKLFKEKMRTFKDVFGYYPKTVASWLIDTYTINYLAAKYDISAFAICRDQVSTDAYTLVGGYFNQAYYPSKNNMFTPAQTAQMRVNVPVFRLLGPCPIHNYEGTKGEK